MSLTSVADQLIGEEMRRCGIKRPDALARVAKAAGLAPGTVANFLRGRLKYVERIEKALNSLAVTSIERKIADLETQLAIARAIAVDTREPDILGAEIALAKARECIGRARQ